MWVEERRPADAGSEPVVGSLGVPVILTPSAKPRAQRIACPATRAPASEYEYKQEGLRTPGVKQAAPKPAAGCSWLPDTVPELKACKTPTAVRPTSSRILQQQPNTAGYKTPGATRTQQQPSSVGFKTSLSAARRTQYREAFASSPKASLQPRSKPTAQQQARTPMPAVRQSMPASLLRAQAPASTPTAAKAAAQQTAPRSALKQPPQRVPVQPPPSMLSRHPLRLSAPSLGHTTMQFHAVPSSAHQHPSHTRHSVTALYDECSVTPTRHGPAVYPTARPYTYTAAAEGSPGVEGSAGATETAGGSTGRDSCGSDGATENMRAQQQSGSSGQVGAGGSSKVDVLAASLGTLTLLSPVRALRKQREELGSDMVLTPVRRSARHLPPPPTTNAITATTTASNTTHAILPLSLSPVQDTAQASTAQQQSDGCRTPQHGAAAKGQLQQSQLGPGAQQQGGADRLRPLLELTNYAYTPNKYLTPGKTSQLSVETRAPTFTNPHTTKRA